MKMLQRLSPSRLPESIIGAAAQGVGTLPVILTTWAVTKADGLPAAGAFAIQVGIAGGIFGVSQWGLRHLLLVEGTSRHTETEFIDTRLGLSLIALAAVTLAWTTKGGFSGYAIAALALKCSDAFTDLRLGLLQLHRSVRSSFWQILVENAVKTLAAVLAVAMAFRHVLPVAYAVPAYAIVVAALSATLLVGMRGNAQAATSTLRRPTRWMALQRTVVDATPVAIATAACAAVSSLPRALLSSSQDKLAVGVAGVSLTLSGAMSLLFTSTWVSSARQVRLAGWTRTTMKFLTIEYVKTSCLAALGAPILAVLVAKAYGFPQEYVRYAVILFLASIVFYCGMGLANMQKFSTRRALEALIYLVGAGVLTLTMRQARLSVDVAMSLSGIAMAFMALTFATVSLRLREVGSD